MTTETFPAGIDARDNKDFIKQGNDTSKLHLILDISRIGGTLFGVKMEYTYFPPRSGLNHLFEMAILKWPKDFSMMWSIMSFPIEFKPQAEAIAEECGLRLADGVPNMIGGNEVQVFPLNGETVFTLENIRNHQIYQNDSINAKKLSDEEFAACDLIINSDREKMKQEMQDKGYTEEQFYRILKHWEGGDETYDETPAG